MFKRNVFMFLDFFFCLGTKPQMKAKEKITVERWPQKIYSQYFKTKKKYKKVISHFIC